MIATTAKEQQQAMLGMVERAMRLSPFERVQVVGDLLAAQLTLNGMLIDEIEKLKRSAGDGAVST